MLREFCLADMAAFPDIVKAMEFTYGEPGRWMQRIEQPALTVTDHGVPVCAGGVHLMHLGCGEGWLISNGSLGKRALWFVHGWRRTLELIEEEYGLWRIQATVDAEVTAPNRLMGLLGFREEGICRNYFGPKHDAVMYARVRTP